MPKHPPEPAHDILAAEAFAVPAPDPRLSHDIVVPEDPTGTGEPHDILAAEEFAMPAPESGSESQRRAGQSRRRLWRWAALPAGLLVVRRLRRHHS